MPPRPEAAWATLERSAIVAAVLFGGIGVAAVVLNVLERHFTSALWTAGLTVAVISGPFVVRLRRRQAEAGGDWVRTARTLSRRDRFTLWRAAIRGRAVQDPRLAALAIRRAEAFLAMQRVTYGTGRKVAWVIATVLALFGGIVLLLDRAWVAGSLVVLLAVIGLAGWRSNWGMTVTKRAIERNRAIVSGESGGPATGQSEIS